ncbi:MAG TPA: hypothetical protein VK524_14320 [Polyangiaceae bacterium]|nr:hypothetical protein [Polyangiaceae bacterium]
MAALCLTGCWEMGRAGDAKIPGELLGDYSVKAELQNSTCGEGALGSQEEWQFDVRLSRKGSLLYWLNGREAISGNIAADGVSFAIETNVKVEALSPGRGRLGCTIWRSDRTSGKLMGQAEDVPGFTGQLGFAYTPEGNSDCTELMGVAGGFAGLPCEMTYAYSAVRR